MDVHSFLVRLMIEIGEVFTLSITSSVAEGRLFSASDVVDMIRRDMEVMVDDAVGKV